MTDAHQLHTSRRLYGANAIVGLWSKKTIESGAGRFAPGPTDEPRLHAGRRFPAIPAVVILLCVVLGAVTLAFGGARLIRTLPLGHRLLFATGAAASLQPVRFDAVTASVIKAGERDVLLVEGSMQSQRDQTTEAPSLRLAVRDANRNEIYVWIARPPKPTLEAHERAIFRTRLETPPANAASVWVRAARPGEAAVPSGDGL